MRLPTHFSRLQGDDVQNWAVGTAETIETTAEVIFLKFIWESGEI